MAKYSEKAEEIIGEVMHEFKEGKLKSGKNGSGGIVTNRKQAIAIGISEAEAAGEKVPEQEQEKETTEVALPQTKHAKRPRKKINTTFKTRLSHD